MGKKEMTIIGITALVVLILAPKLRTLPLLNKVPTV